MAGFILLLGCGEEEEKVSFLICLHFHRSSIYSLPFLIQMMIRAIIIKELIDPDGGDVTLTYLWYKYDVLQEDLTGETVSADLTYRGEIWTVAVISSDGSLDSADTRRSVTIRNSIPFIDTIDLEWIDSEGAAVDGADAPTVGSVLADMRINRLGYCYCY